MARRLSVLIFLVMSVVFLTSVQPAFAGQPVRAVTDINYNQDEFGPSLSSLNSLDLYLPATPDNARVGLRPVVVWVHGGGWMNGDKSNRMPDKVRLFNDLGYIVASVNYRLSPDITQGFTGAFDPARIRSPDHVADLGEAIGWLSRNIGSYGGDPDALVLAGHSAGAHLVSLAGTSPAWVEGRRVSQKQILGVVSLDTETFDVRKEADSANPLNSMSRLFLIWNAFGTPTEESAEPRWERSSPIAYADPSDPPFLLVTQSHRPLRVAANDEMANALGQDPAQAVVGVPLDHEGINTNLGSPADTTVETTRVTQFVRDVVSSARPAGVKITKRPRKRVTVRVPRRAGRAVIGKIRRKVTFGFKGTGRATGFQCRIDKTRFKNCRSPRSYRLKRGKHTFRVRALYPSGRPGEMRKVTFRISTRR